MHLRNKTILITGGSGGIGFALSKELVKRGAKVFSIDKAEPKERLQGISFFKADITKSQGINKVLKKINRPLDIVINNAGVMRRGKIFDTTEKDFDLLFNIHLKASWLMLKLAKAYLVKKPTIIQMSSRHGQTTPLDPAIYGLSKRAVIDFSELVQKTYPSWRVKILCPGSIDTPLAWEGVKKSDIKAKKKMVRSPEYLVGKIIDLIESDKKYLLFDEKKWDEIIK